MSTEFSGSRRRFLLGVTGIAAAFRAASSFVKFPSVDSLPVVHEVTVAEIAGIHDSPLVGGAFFPDLLRDDFNRLGILSLTSLQPRLSALTLARDFGVMVIDRIFQDQNIYNPGG